MRQILRERRHKSKISETVAEIGLRIGTEVDLTIA